jgi:adenosylcobinamide amidohydrolase
MSDRELPPSFEREWPEFLDEIRVVLPGVQILFGFLLAAPFSSHFEMVIGRAHKAYVLCFLTTAAASIFLIAPSVYHRLHWRRDVRDKEQMLGTCNLLAIIGGLLLAIAMASAVYVVTSVVTSGWFTNLMSAATTLLIAILWFGLPLLRRQAERRRRS